MIEHIKRIFEVEKCRLYDDKITDYMGNLCENCKNLLYEGNGYEIIELRDEKHINKNEFIQIREKELERKKKQEQKQIKILKKKYLGKVKK